MWCGVHLTLVTCSSNTGIWALVLHRPRRRAAELWTPCEAPRICLFLPRPKRVYRPFARESRPVSPHARRGQRWTAERCQIKTWPSSAGCLVCCRWIWSGPVFPCGSRRVKCRCRAEKWSPGWRVCFAAEDLRSWRQKCIAALRSLSHTQRRSPRLNTSSPALSQTKT